MYHKFFGIDEQAFSIAVNPRYMYMSVQHKEALAHLLYGVSSGGFVMLTGEVGTGKTTIIRCLLEQLPKTADLAIVLNPSANARDLICSICDELRITYDPSEKSTKVLSDALSEFLIENHQRGHKTIVLIDEAQLLRVSTLEQVRLLTNLETNTQKLLQIILVGQPELNDLLAKPALRQLSQRITARYHLRPLNEKETEAYIKHRLVIAGMPPGRQPFTSRIYKRIFQITHGIPRLINVLCDRMLLGAYSRDTTEINSEICKQAALEVLGEIPNPKNAKTQQWIIAGATGTMVFLLTTVLFWLWFGQGTSNTPTVPPTNMNTEAVKTATPVTAARAPKTITQTVTAAPAVASAANPFWFFDEASALRAVATALRIDLFGGAEPCIQLRRLDWECEKHNVATWDDLKKLDRAGALKIITPSKHQAYVALVGLSETHAWIKTEQNTQTITLEELGTLWNGDFIFIWRKPYSYTETIGKGTKAPLVKWVAQQFALLDEQDAPLSHDFFNGRLQTRVKLFQQDNNLEDDGYVGLHTLLKLNAALGRETPLSELQNNNIQDQQD